MKKDPSTVIEITDTHVKLLQAKGQRAEQLSDINIRRIEQYTDDHIASLVQGLISGRDIPAETLWAVIPRRLILLKQISLPSHSPDEIKRILNLQAANYVPYAREDIIFDFKVLDKEPSGYSRVLAAFVHREVAERFLGIFKKARLHPHKLVLSSEGVVDWFSSQRSGSSSAGKVDVIINVDDVHTDICFHRQGQLLFSRSIQFGARDLNKDGIAACTGQIELTFGTYKKEKMGPEIAQIFLVSSAKGIDLMTEKLREYYQIPVHVLFPTYSIQGIKDVAPSAVEITDGLSVASCLGFLLTEKDAQMNFMPLGLQSLSLARKRRAAWVKLLLAAALTGVMGVGALQLSSYRDEQYLDELERRIDESKAGTKSAEEKLNALRSVADKVRNRVVVADVFRELYKLTPDDVYYQSISLDPKGGLTLQGYTPAGGSVNSLQERLVNSSHFKGVTLDYATKKKRSQGEFTDFKMSCVVAARSEGN